MLYPFFLDSTQSKRRESSLPTALPIVDVLIAAYNEERVLAEKLDSIVSSDYPIEKISIQVGSDGSSDTTEEIVRQYCARYENITLHSFDRSGKTATVNKLMVQANSDIVILTDANVIFTQNTIRAIISYFSDKDVGLVGANIKAKKKSDVGITLQENEYLERENRMKLKEGELWGTMMGAFGGCYAIRRRLFKKVPDHFLVDDFNISMSVLDQGYDCILAEEAICHEDISSKLSEEFRRKVRMSTGNFQNLKVYSNFIWSSRKGLAFSFISHKILRWLTPLLLIVGFINSWLLMDTFKLFKVLFYIQLTLFSVPLMEMSLDAIGIKSRFIRFITYFISMNLALLIGMFNSLRRVRTATWQPTERNL